VLLYLAYEYCKGGAMSLHSVGHSRGFALWWVLSLATVCAFSSLQSCDTVSWVTGMHPAHNKQALLIVQVFHSRWRKKIKC